MRDEAARPTATLRARDAVAIAVGIVVGAGIFRTPAIVAGLSGSPADMLWLWLIGGGLSVVGALCYAELAAAWPGAGGDYGYLVRAYGRRAGFVYAWARLAVIQTGSVALLAFIVGDYAAAVAGGASAAWAAATVVLLTAINVAGVRAGTRTQALLTLAEVAGLILVVVAGLIIAPEAVAAAPRVTETQWGAAMVLVLLTYGGWNETVYVTGELRGARTRIVGVLLASLGVVTLLYLLVNFAYLRGLGLAGIAASDAPAADLLGRALGPAGSAAIAVAVAVAALTSANATMFTGARSSWAWGRDVPALAWLGRWDGVRGTPGNALLVQGGVSLLLVGAGALVRDGFSLAVDYTAPVFWLFFLAVGIALFVLRRREPDTPRPFRVPLYPVLPGLFCASNAWLLWSSLAYVKTGAVVGVAVLGAGIILSFVLQPSKEPLP